jgi:protein-S-isoprenylcysteine O-methyltransferase Ste14
MLSILALLVGGFAIDIASAFTTAFSRRWGERRGRQVTFVLRNVLGIPIWVVGFVLAARTRSPALYNPTVVTQTVAWLLLLAGAVIQVFALLALRARAAMPSTRDSLVEHGVYGRIRHPIYAGVLLEFAGALLVKPTQMMALGCLMGLVWAWLQARCEEIDLVERLPAYREYMQRVPRFLPRIRTRQGGHQPV